ncbi:C-reactive protein-like [Heteronotia binoei]|uniref:C-reactive protein-like n=1 Tax=Heteronotia binoei TaxID=13085 RepID=UPI0029314C18|nr:C-reactive protein-like [Heteronotia binoei]
MGLVVPALGEPAVAGHRSRRLPRAAGSRGHVHTCLAHLIAQQTHTPRLARLHLAAAALEELLYLWGRAFVFPPEGTENLVILKSTQEEPLHSFTLCLRSFTNLIQKHTLFSYASEDQYGDIIIYKTYLDMGPQYMVIIGGEETAFRVPDSYLRWKSSCVTWESEMGVITLRIGDFVLARRVLQKGYCIGPPNEIMLGNSSYYAGFSGEIKDVYMWNVAIPIRELRTTSWDSVLLPPIINWRKLHYEIQGNVTLV